MKKTFIFVFCALLALSAAANPVFTENFEDPEKVAFSTFSITADNPASGEYCGHLGSPSSSKNDISLATGKNVIPVDPNQWYRMSVKTRNNIKIGEIKFGLIESRSAKKRVSQFYDWHWKAVSLNINEWRSYSMEFKTAANTKGIVMYIRTENRFSGSSWWDDIRLEKFEKKYPPLEIKPFRAAATYTDIPTKNAFAVTKGKRGVITRNETKYFWEELELSKEKLEILYRDLPQRAVLKTSLIRGGKTVHQEERRLAGTGKADFSLALEKLPEGIYRFEAVLQQNGKNVFALSKEIWRIDSLKCRTPKHEPIRKSSAGPGRQRLVNGKIYNRVFASSAPTWGLFPHHKKFCKPELSAFMRNIQEQFGEDVFTVWAWRGPQWDSKREEFRKKAAADCRDYLDFLQKINCYGMVCFVISAHKKEQPDFEDVRSLVRALRDHPALLEWSLDEPEFKYSPEFMKKLADIIRQEDPDHLININLCDPSKFHLYAPSSDVASYDIYPFPGTSLVESRKRTQALLKAFPTAPFDSYLQMFNFKTLEMPSFNQLRASFLLDRINGSHSLSAYCWAATSQCFLTDQELQSYYRAVVSMFRRLEPVLRNPGKQPIAVKSSHEFIASGVFQDGDAPVLILVNLSNDAAADVSFDHSAKKAEDFFDAEWKYTSKNGKFQFRLEPNQSLVLRLVK